MITELKWDTAFFRRKIGRLTKIPSENKLKQLIQKAQRQGYAYLTSRLNLKDVSNIQLLESNGFYITDIGITWEQKIDKLAGCKSSARTATAGDIPALRSMAKGLFRDSRFYNDPFFDRKEADELYQKWIENSLLDKDIRTLIVDNSGFITCKETSKNLGDIPLIGVIPKKQSKGIGRSLMCAALKWFKKMGIKTVTVRTQANNIKAMNFYMGAGFKVKYVDVTMGLILNKK